MSSSAVAIVTIHGPAENAVPRTATRSAMHKNCKMQFRAMQLGIFMQNAHENTSRNTGRE